MLIKLSSIVISLSICCVKTLRYSYLTYRVRSLYVTECDETWSVFYFLFCYNVLTGIGYISKNIYFKPATTIWSVSVSDKSACSFTIGVES